MKKYVVSLFDKTGVMVKPWLDAGYEAFIVDIQHPPAYADKGITTENKLHKVYYDLSMPWLPPVEKDSIKFTAAFPPCFHLAVSGAKWFKGKGLRALGGSINMFATAAEFCEWAGAPYMIENPVSTISTYWRKPDYNFHPWYFTGYNPEDNYTKKTCLWTGNGFRMPDKFIAENAEDPDDRIHKCPPGDKRSDIRSKTPEGFAKAVYETNK